MDPHVAVEVRLVAGAVLTDRTDERLLARVDLEVSVQKGFSDEAFAAAGPGAGVAVLVHLFGVRSHVRFSEEGDPAAEVRTVQPLVHGHHVTLQVVPTVRLVVALRVSALERLVVPFAGVAVRRRQLGRFRFFRPLVLLRRGKKRLGD